MTDATQPADVTIRKGRMEDVEAIHGLVAKHGGGDVLPRSRAELYESLRDFEVAEAGGEVVGCAALAIAWEGLAEVRSLVVDAGHRGRGVGRRLVEACLDEARRLHIGRVFALTTSRGFFERMGFAAVEMETLPHKIWSDCVACPKFPSECDEEAVAIELGE